VLSNNRITGAVLYGDVKDGPWYFDLIQNGTDIAAIRQTLLFGEALSARAA
jgi:nitrite reductase (NADH) large subunit